MFCSFKFHESWGENWFGHHLMYGYSENNHISRPAIRVNRGVTVINFQLLLLSAHGGQPHYCKIRSCHVILSFLATSLSLYVVSQLKTHHFCHHIGVCTAIKRCTAKPPTVIFCCITHAMNLRLWLSCLCSFPVDCLFHYNTRSMIYFLSSSWVYPCILV